MKSQRRWIGFGIAVPLLLSLSACAGMNRPYPAKQHFALQAGQREQAGAAAGKRTLRVREFRVASPFHGRQFTYKVGDAEFKNDYYYEFITSPASLITSATIAWLRDAGLFATVLPGGSAADNEFLLEGTVTALYGDYSDRAAPAAVLEMQVFLLSESGPHIGVVFDRTYRQRVALGESSPAGLVGGWNQALRATLTKLEQDLRSDRTILAALSK